MIFDYTWIFTIASIVGAAANACQKRWGFILWFITNGFWCFYDWRLGLYSQSLLYLVFCIISIVGFIYWKGSKKRGCENGQV